VVTSGEAAVEVVIGAAVEAGAAAGVNTGAGAGASAEDGACVAPLLTISTSAQL